MRSSAFLCFIIAIVLCLSGCASTSNADADPATSPSSTDAGAVTSSDCQELDEETYGNLELETDLNGDGRPDVVIENLQECGASMCPVTVLAACEGGGYEAVADLDYFTPGGITRGEDTTHGWYALQASTAKRDEEGLWETTPVVFVWNGETYELDED